MEIEGIQGQPLVASDSFYMDLIKLAFISVVTAVEDQVVAAGGVVGMVVVWIASMPAASASVVAHASMAGVVQMAVVLELDHYFVDQSTDPDAQVGGDQMHESEPGAEFFLLLNMGLKHTYKDKYYTSIVDSEIIIP